MGSEDLPEWMRERGASPAEPESKPLRHVDVSLRLLPMAALLAIAAYTAFELPDGVHLPIIGAGAYAFIAAIFWPLKCTRVSVSAFIAAAVAVSLGMALVIVEGVREQSWLVGVASTVLFTGAIGLLLLVRARAKPSRRTKVTLMAAMVAACLSGPVMYLSLGADGGILESVIIWLLVATLPFVVLALGTLFVLSSYHESEQTLPSDKWV